MLLGAVRNQVDQVWKALWSGGISNPLEVIEQITYLLFLRRLDELQLRDENRSRTTGATIERRIFSKAKDERGRSYEDLRWSRFKHFEATETYTVVDQHVFPFLRTLGRTTRRTPTT